MNNRIQQQQRGIPQKGAALLLFVVFFVFTSLTLVLTIARGAYDDLVSYRALASSKASLYAAEAGIEDAIYRHRQGENYSSSETFTIAGVTVTTTRNLVIDTYEILAEGNAQNAVRNSTIDLSVGVGASFNFGLQAGNGGIFMENNSTIRGNVFANGTVEGANNNIVYGDVISAGPSGIVDSVHATGSVWANRIESADVDKDAYYQTIVGTTVGGVSYPGSPNQATATMPITDAMITGFESDAAAGTVIASTSASCSSGKYAIGSDVTIGPIKIECDLEISGNSTDVYLAGAVWVTGNITIKNNPNIRIDSSVTGKSVAFIADKTTNRTTSSKITLENNAVFSGYGTGSYILMISQNNSRELGGSEVAVAMKNNATGAVLLYAAHGEILVENGSGLKEVTGYYIHTQNNTQIIYESGIASLLFTSGPGGGYAVQSWREVE